MLLMLLLMLLLLWLLLLSYGFPVVHPLEVFARNGSLVVWRHCLRRHCFSTLFFEHLFPNELSQPYVRLVLFVAILAARAVAACVHHVGCSFNRTDVFSDE